MTKGSCLHLNHNNKKQKKKLFRDFRDVEIGKLLPHADSSIEETYIYVYIYICISTSLHCRRAPQPARHSSWHRRVKGQCRHDINPEIANEVARFVEGIYLVGELQLTVARFNNKHTDIDPPTIHSLFSG